MYFNSMQYLFFFAGVFLLYYMIPRKARYIWLLVVSYYFYMSWNAKYALLLLGVTTVSYIGALIMERAEQKGQLLIKKLSLATVISVSLLLLLYFKYANFIIENINGILHMTGSGKSFSAWNIILPVGISFYLFQAMGYAIDVYRKNIAAEKNFLYYALFISFFPQLLAGPIGRAGSLMGQLHGPKELTGDRFREGMLLILIGLWQKVLLADNFASVTGAIFTGYTSYSGCAIIMAILLFGIQIYCDFAGYSNMALGSAKLFGIDLMTNFSTPYLATNVSDFWRRWHISLTSWFRDYVYIPLGGNRKGQFRKYLNTLIVFLLSGIWHGAAWNFIFWGVLNGIMIVVRDSYYAIRWKGKKVSQPEASATKQSMVTICAKRIATFLLIDMAWFFFKVPSLKDAVLIMKQAAGYIGTGQLLSGEIFGYLGSTSMQIVLFVSVLILFFIDLMQEKTGSFVQYLSERKALVRWVFYLALIMMIILFGAYGEGYEQTAFIYFQF